MTFYERPRGGGPLTELPEDSSFRLEAGVISGRRVTRVGTVVDPDKLKIDHHDYGYPGIGKVSRIRSGKQVNKERLWRENLSGDSSKDRRVIWVATSKRE